MRAYETPQVRMFSLLHNRPFFCFSGLSLLFFFFFNDTATTEIYTLSLHDALPISTCRRRPGLRPRGHQRPSASRPERSEEHTSELQSPCNLVCRLLLEKKKKQNARSLHRRHMPRWAGLVIVGLTILRG